MPAFPRVLPIFMGLAMLLVGMANSRATDTNEFLARIYTNAAGGTLPYRLLPPKHYDPSRAYPVILYLHGAAGRGEDNVAPLDWGPRLFLEGSTRERSDFFLVVPQCPRGLGWTEFPLAPGSKEPLRMATELVSEALPREVHLDAKRRYVTGVSMGGHAVWVALSRHPGLFAAGVPVCAPGEPAAATKLAARCPVWAFHSDDDHLVPVQQTREMIQLWKDRGGIAKYTEYHGLQHSSWKKAYVDPALFDWLLSQRLP